MREAAVVNEAQEVVAAWEGIAAVVVVAAVVVMGVVVVVVVGGRLYVTSAMREGGQQ
jgi:hypothetical protein